MLEPICRVLIEGMALKVFIMIIKIHKLYHTIQNGTGVWTVVLVSPEYLSHLQCLKITRWYLLYEQSYPSISWATRRIRWDSDSFMFIECSPVLHSKIYRYCRYDILNPSRVVGSHPALVRPTYHSGTMKLFKSIDRMDLLTRGRNLLPNDL